MILKETNLLSGLNIPKKKNPISSLGTVPSVAGTTTIQRQAADPIFNVPQTTTPLPFSGPTLEPGMTGYGGTTPPPPGVIGQGGQNPYYFNILNDPIYKQLQANLAAQGVQSAQQRQSNTRQALVQFGEVPDLTSTVNGLGLDPNSPMYQTLFGDVDAGTKQQAQNLTDAGLSTVAGLSRQHAKDIQDLLDSQAARGVVRSGGTGVGLGQADQAYSGNQYNARQSLLQYLSGVQAAYAQSQLASQQQLQQGASDAVTRQLDLLPNGQSSGGVYSL